MQYTKPALVNAMVQWRHVGNQFEDADNRDALGSYYVVDMSASRDLSEAECLSERQEGQLVMGIQNLFNRSYNVDRGGDIFKTGPEYAAMPPKPGHVDSSSLFQSGNESERWSANLSL